MSLCLISYDFNRSALNEWSKSDYTNTGESYTGTHTHTHISPESMRSHCATNCTCCVVPNGNQPKRTLPSMKMTTKIKAEKKTPKKRRRKKWCWNETKPKRRNHERPWSGERGKRNSFVCRFFASSSSSAAAAAAASARLH